MKQGKRLAAIVLSAALVLALAACGPASEPASSSKPASSSGSTTPGSSSSEKPSSSDAEKELEWKDSKTMAYLKKLGVTPENVTFKASYAPKASKDPRDKNYVRYQARGNKARLICYTDAEYLNPYQVIYKDGSTYYLGVYDDEEGSVEWYDADDFVVEEFKAVQKICKIPTSTELNIGYQVMDLNTEIVSLSHSPYRFTLDALGRLTTVRTSYNSEVYEATFEMLEPCPAGTTFEKPVVKDTQ